jgi:renal tumor antigen
MHRNGIYHRDIKPENILITGDTVKLADFGSCRGIYSKPPFTEYISTRWYRPPECLLTDGYYNHKMDYWGIGCVFYEILTLQPLFPGTNELDQIHKIHDILGTPDKSLMDQFQKVASHMEFNFPKKKPSGIAKLIPQHPDAHEIIKGLLIYNHNNRASAAQVLKHSYFKELRDADRANEASSSNLLSTGINSIAPTPSQMSKVFKVNR